MHGISLTHINSPALPLLSNPSPHLFHFRLDEPISHSSAQINGQQCVDAIEVGLEPASVCICGLKAQVYIAGRCVPGSDPFPK